MNYEADLFGTTPDGTKARALPRKGSKEHEQREGRLRRLTLPYDLTYWSLAPDCLAANTPEYVECIWATDPGGKFWRLIVDLRTGQKWDGS